MQEKIISIKILTNIGRMIFNPARKVMKGNYSEPINIEVFYSWQIVVCASESTNTFNFNSDKLSRGDSLYLLQGCLVNFLS